MRLLATSSRSPTAASTKKRENQGQGLLSTEKYAWSRLRVPPPGRTAVRSLGRYSKAIVVARGSPKRSPTCVWRYCSEPSGAVLFSAKKYGETSLNGPTSRNLRVVSL